MFNVFHVSICLLTGNQLSPQLYQLPYLRGSRLTAMQGKAAYHDKSLSSIEDISCLRLHASSSNKSFSLECHLIIFIVAFKMLFNYSYFCVFHRVAEDKHTLTSITPMQMPNRTSDPFFLPAL